MGRAMRGALFCAAMLSGTSAAVAQPAAAPIRIEVVGGLGGVVQYTRHEEPFWTKRVPALTAGRLRADIAPFDSRGIRGQEMLPLMRAGAVPFGTVLVALAAAEEPELNALDLPGMSPDLAELRRTVARWRPHVEDLLRERYGVELLAIYTHPAQVVFCRGAFTGLLDLAGRRVRTSSVSQSEFVAALGAIPVVTPFAEMVDAVRSSGVQCAITGTLSGNAVGLHEVTTHVSRKSINWGISVFGANVGAWNALPEDVRGMLRTGLATLEQEIWNAAGAETEDGLACNAGRPDCTTGRPGRMTIVEPAPRDDELRRQLVERTVVPAWIRRCGAACDAAWQRLAAPGQPAAAAPR
jgi:TRAP-type C4-dicarboxylate transport system substrate-binding protein